MVLVKLKWYPANLKASSFFIEIILCIIMYNFYILSDNIIKGKMNLSSFE